MRTLYSNIKHLIGIEEATTRKKIVKGAEMADLQILESAWLLCDQHAILGFGSMEQYPETGYDREENLNGRSVLPVWIDSHTHLVFAKSREQEFVDRIRGLSYEEIARRGGGILNSAQRLAEAGEEELLDAALARLDEVKKMSR